MASRIRIFLDTDVMLDHLAERQPFAECAHRIFALSETDEITLCVSSLSFNNLYYILRKLKGHGEALALLSRVKALVRVLPVSDAEISSALTANFKDFEDAIQHFSAKSDGGVSALITRNKVDYSCSTIPVLLPEEFVFNWQKST